MAVNNGDAEPEEETEETKWQDRISSGFDRLVAFASTELDKRRRSTEGSENCNTSPDSGIGTDSASSMPLPPNKQTKLNPNPKPTLFKMPTNKVFLESPPISDPITDESGPPRTPSPSSPPSIPINFSPERSEKSPTRLNPALLKYQRPTEDKKHKPDHHFKKKFYYRDFWRDDIWPKRGDDQVDTAKDKFKPKGKEWNWNKDHKHEMAGMNEMIEDAWGRNHDRFSTWKN